MPTARLVLPAEADTGLRPGGEAETAATVHGELVDAAAVPLAGLSIFLPLGRRLVADDLIQAFER